MLSAKGLDTLGRFSFLQGRQLLWLSVCFPAHQPPSGKWSTPKEFSLNIFYFNNLMYNTTTNIFHRIRMKAVYLFDSSPYFVSLNVSLNKGSKSFPFRVDPFSEDTQNNSDRAAIPLKVHQFLISWGLRNDVLLSCYLTAISCTIYMRYYHQPHYTDICATCLNLSSIVPSQRAAGTNLRKPPVWPGWR